MPQKYPWVLQETRKTPRTKTIGVMVYVSNVYCRNRFTANAARRMKTIKTQSSTHNSFFLNSHHLSVGFPSYSSIYPVKRHPVFWRKE
jgi:hypothetical protein